MLQYADTVKSDGDHGKHYHLWHDKFVNMLARQKREIPLVVHTNRGHRIEIASSGPQTKKVEHHCPLYVLDFQKNTERNPQ